MTTCMMMIATALWAALAVVAAATPPTLTTAAALALVATLAGATALAARTATAAMTMITSATHAGAGTGLGLTTGTTAGPTGGSGRQQGMVAALGATGAAAATAAGRWAMSLAAGLIGSATWPTGLGMERAGMEALSTGTCCHPRHPRGQVAAQQGLHRRSQPQLLRPWRQAWVRQAGAMTVTATSTSSVRRLRQSWRALRLTWRG